MMGWISAVGCHYDKCFMHESRDSSLETTEEVNCIEPDY